MANLLEEASILLTPTAYDNGKMLAVKPEIALGEENVTNGDFATDSDWSKGSGVTISDGEALITVTNGGYQFLGQSVTYISGKSYTLTASVNGTIGSGCTFFDASGNNGGLNTSNGIVTFNGEKQYISFDFIANNNSNTVLITRNGTGDYSFSIDNVSVKEDVSGDFTFSRNSAATRVNAQGLVENVQILSSDLVSNGNFSQEGVQEVSNGSFSQEGVEQVTNGDFENWTADSPNNWTVVNEDANNYVTQDGTYAKIVSNDTSSIQIKQTIFTIGKTYRVDLDAVVNNGNVEGLKLNDATAAATIGYVNSTGHHTFYFKAEGTFFVINRKGGGNTDISIDNVSVKEVGQDWALGTGWSIGEDKAVANTTGNFVNIYQNSTFVVGKTYKTTFTISDYTQGSVRLTENGYDISGFQNAVGTYTTYFTASQTDLYMQGHSSFIGSITNISVKEVGQNWVVGSGWSIGDNKSTFNLSSGAGNVSQINVFESGKTYRITFDTLETNGGNLAYRIGAGGFVFINAIAANTKHTITETATSDGSFSLRGATNFNGSITNISVIEITDDTNLPRINYEGFSYQDSLGSEEVVNGDFATDSDWTLGAGSTISGGILNHTGSSSDNFQTISITEKQYKLEYTIVSGSGSVRFWSNVGSYTTEQTGVGTYVSYFYYDSSIGNNGRFSIVLDGDISIDNVSVKEVLGQEVVPNSGCGSWLMEGQSTNLIPYSEDFSNASWYPFNATALIGFTSPSGVANASKLVESISNSSHGISYNYSSTSSMAFSVFAKAAERTFIQMQAAGVGSTDCIFNLSNGTIVSSEVNATADIKDYGNGWYRCSIYYNSAGTNNATIKLYNGGDSYQGDGASGVYIWGAMFEQKSYSTSYIPTSGATSTRLQDIATNSGNASLINSESGVLYAEISANDIIGGKWISLSNGTTNERLSVAFQSNDIRVYIRNTSGLIWDYSVAASVLNFNKIAVKFKSSDYAIWINGVEAQTSTNANIVANLNSLQFDSGGGGSNFYGKTKALAVYKTALTDASLRSLTYPPAVATTFDLNFNTIAEQFTFTRGSEATFVNSQGLIQSTASNDAPRLDYSTGAEAFLLEPQSTNLITYSEDFTQWANQGAIAITSNYGISPDGTNNSTRIVFSGGSQQIYKNFTSSSGVNGSVYVKGNSGDEIKIGVTGGEQIITLNGNWQRVTTYSASSTRFTINTFSATARDIQIWGAQVEEQSYATSYIPTSGASATRNQELCNNATPVINSEEGTLYAEIGSLIGDESVGQLSLSNGTANETIKILYLNSNSVRVEMQTVSGVNFVKDITLTRDGTFDKVAIRYKSNNYAVYHNGVSQTVTQTASTPIGLNKIAFNRGDGGSIFFGNTKGLKVYPKALADVQLEDLTTI